MAEGEGVEPSTLRSARFSGPVACRHAPPSELVVPARLERATPAVGERCSRSTELRDKNLDREHRSARRVARRLGRVLQETQQPRDEAPTRWVSRKSARPNLRKSTKIAWYAQEESNLQPRSSPELTTGISRPLCQLSYGRAKMVRVVGFEPTASCVRGRHSRRAELHPVGAP